MRAPKGFTLLEVTLTITTVISLMAIAIPFSVNYQSRNDFHVAVETTVQSLRRAQALAAAGQNDTPWGVHIATGSITLFSGQTYAERSVERDETFVISENITPSGSVEMVFGKLTGYPLSAGVMTLTSRTNTVVNVAVNEKGMVAH